MLRSFYITLIYLSFIALGISAPFVLSLGYVWVDTFDPQQVAYAILNQIPVSLIMAIAAIGGFLVLERRKGGLTLLSVLLVVFAFWVTLTTAMWAEVPVDAWVKWNYAFKTLCFAAFVPFVFRSRIQIEAFLQIYLFAILVHFLPVGVKTLISGGGYGRTLGVVGGNSLLAEGSTLAAVSLMLVPIILYLRKHSIIIPKTRWTQLGYLGLVVVAVSAAMGTFERTGLVGMAVVAGGLWLRSRRKILYACVALVGLSGVGAVTSDAWNERISTIKDYSSESSALGRILVWKWTLGYVSTHPLGGGFNDFMIDKITFPPDVDGVSVVRKGIAFHSIYFEVLGEQGWPGLALFAAMIVLTLSTLQRVAQLSRRVESLLWAKDLAYALQVSVVTLLACGAFIGIAFQPMLYYLFAIAACLRSHSRQISDVNQASLQIKRVVEPV